MKRACTFACLRMSALLVLSSSATPGGQAQKQPATAPVTFADVTMPAGIAWQHVNGATPEKYLIETMGGGGGFLDYNGDGLLDIFFVQSGCHKFAANCRASKNALYRQNPDGTLADVAAAAGVADSGTYGMGLAVADFDNDGHPDIYVTGFPHNVLYRNNGDGTFTDATHKAGVAGSGWGTSAAFFDYNHDGLSDLYVGRYLDWDYDKNLYCGERRPGYRSYCHPDEFRCLGSVLFRNNGDGTFTDVSEKSGIGKACGKALGVVAFDFDGDGWPDLFVANDAVPNFLFRNNQDGTFTETALLAEVALGYSGKPQSGMGTDSADLDGEARPGLFVTNIDHEPNNLFHNNGDGTFTDITVERGMGTVALGMSGFGTRFLDFDNDGKLDLVVLNGHVLDNIALYHEGVAFAERPFLLHNTGTRFEEVGALHGAAFQKAYVGRALATGDYDNDGDTDLLWVINGGPPVLLRNDGGNRSAWIGFDLRGTASGRDALGAIVTVATAGRRQAREKVGGASYLAAHDPRMLFGLGDAKKVDKVEVRWPSGVTSVLENVPAGQYVRVEEPAKKTAAYEKETGDAQMTGVRLHYREAHEGHSWGSWRARIPEALRFLWRHRNRKDDADWQRSRACE